jgi:hypothetical protein
MKLILPLLALSLISAGCASYATPGRGAPMEVFGAAPAANAAQQQRNNADPWIQSQMDRKPLASFPAAIAVARVQAPGYHSYTAPVTYGDGRYTVVTSRDVETPEQIETMEKLPMVRGLAPLNRLVIPANLQSDDELRQAAAKVRADILLVYTLDTSFVEKDRTTPLSVVTLGAAPTKQMQVACTASAALLDTRSGFIYGLAEWTERKDTPRNAWTTEMEIDRFRLETEKASFARLVGELQNTWNKVVHEYAPTTQPIHAASAE